MYDYLLELEDLERMLLIVPAEERSKIIDAKNEVADRMFSCFCISDSGLVSTYIRCVLVCSSLLIVRVREFQHPQVRPFL